MSDETSVARKRRLAENQTLFRNVNERIESLNENFGVVLPMGDFVCECSDEECTSRIALSVAEYETIREHGARFAVAPTEQHVFVDVETVIERNDRFWVVEKFGAPADLAKERDPRSDRAES